MKKYSLADFHMLYTELDDSYAKIQKSYDIPETEFWCLIAIRMGIGSYQNEISKSMKISKQTVNSSLKQLEKKNMIYLESEQNNLRKKKISLSETGVKFAKEYIDPIETLEEKAWNYLSIDEQNILMDITKKLSIRLEQETELYIHFIKNKKNDS